MTYYLDVSSWNLLESFVTESISPFSFYSARNFGNNLSRFRSNKNEKTNVLLLSKDDMGGDITICVDSELLDEKLIFPTKKNKTFFTYSKTIYYKKGFVSFRFNNEEFKNELIAESQILFEVKCLDKYISDFYVKAIPGVNKVSLKDINNAFNFEIEDYIGYDNSTNYIKGAVIGYIRGLLTTNNQSDNLLIKEIKTLKNALTGLNTQIMVSDVYVQTPETYLFAINKIQNLLKKRMGKQLTSCEVLKHQFADIVKLANLRYNELVQYKTPLWLSKLEKLNKEKEKLDRVICKIELDSNIFGLQQELESIKNKEKKNGLLAGLSRKYFKKGSYERERKEEIKSQLEKFKNENLEYKKYLENINEINQQILNYRNNKTQYDATISAIFARISDIINDLLKKVAIQECHDSFDLSDLEVSEENILSIKSDNNNAEIIYLNILLKYIMMESSNEPLSEEKILEFIQESGRKFKDFPVDDNANKDRILNSLTEYWLYKKQKNNQFSIPDNMPIFQSVMSFFIKPFGFDQIERYMINKNYIEKKYAFLLWGVCLGFAAMPKTFTNILYQNEVLARTIDDAIFDFLETPIKRDDRKKIKH